MQPQPRQKPRQSSPTIFLSFFVVLGLVVLGVGIKGLLAGDTRTSKLILPGAIWTIIPIIIMVAMRKQKKQMAIARESRQSDPSPWLHRPDWAKGEIPGSENKQVTGYFMGAIVALVVCSVFSAKILNFKGSLGAFEIIFTSAFLIVPVVMLVVGIRAVLRNKKFGQSTFKMAAVPAAIGGKLEGKIEIGRKIRPAGGFKLDLRCLNLVVTNSGKSRSTTTRVLWEEKSTADDLETDPSHPIIPVSFAIPADCEECDDSDPANRIVWMLEARADVPGIDYLARFEVPVFKVNSNSR